MTVSWDPESRMTEARGSIKYPTDQQKCWMVRCMAARVMRQKNMAMSTMGPGTMMTEVRATSNLPHRQTGMVLMASSHQPLCMDAVKGIPTVGRCYQAINSEERVVICHCSYF